jgi:putative transposase
MMDVTPDSQAGDLDEFAGDSPAGAGELDAVDEQLIARLAGRARAAGLALTGEAGLLAQLTKRLVASASEGEITHHLGYVWMPRTGSPHATARSHVGGHRAGLVGARGRPPWDVAGCRLRAGAGAAIGEVGAC